MAISINFNGATLRKPGSYSKTTVNLTGGFPIAAAGIVGIVGEADAGAPGSAEDIRENFFSPEQVAEVVDKYKAGPIVEAFRLLVAPSNDDRVANGASRIYVYKTNASTQASGALPTTYGTVYSRNYGLDANSIAFQTLAAQLESGPSFASFAFIPDITSASALGVRVNGGAQYAVTVTAGMKPDQFVAAFNAAVTGVLASGGDTTDIISGGEVGDTLTIAFSGGLTATISISSSWNSVPAVGETLFIPVGSVIAGGSNENVGGYVVSAATASTVTALKLADPAQAGANVGPVAIVGITDVQSFEQVTLSYSGTTPSGVGAAVEMFDNSGAVRAEELVYGGTDRGLLSSTRVIDGSKLSLSIVSGASVRVNIDTAFAALAVAGDMLTILPGSILAGAGNANVGSYLVTSATSNEIRATKYSGTPVAVLATDIVALSDLRAFKGIFSTSSVPLMTISSAEPKVTFSLRRDSDSLSEDSVALGGNVALLLGYDGTSGTCTINSVNMVLTVVGGSGTSLTIRLADYETIDALVNYINAQTGYTAAAADNVVASQSPSILDRVAAVGICGEYDGSMPARIKKDSYEVQSFFDASVLCSLTRVAFAGLPTAMATATYLAGGLKGGSSAASVSAGIDSMQKVRINSLVPLFSRDATDDILEGLTEPSSTYQIAAVNAAAKSHALLMSNTTRRSERNAFCSIKASLDDSKDEAASLASSRVSLCIQDVQVLKTDGTLEFVGPWGMAAVAAGMQAGAPIGEPMTFKFINVSGIQHSDFDPQTQADEAIEAGLLFAEAPEQGGVRIVLGNTTYGRDANFVYNRISVLYASDTVAYNLRKQLEAIFVGVGTAVADAEAIKNTTISILNTFKAAGLIIGDDTNGGKGYKNLLVRIEGNVAYVDVTITPVQGIDFVLPSIVLDNIRQTA